MAVRNHKVLLASWARVNDDIRKRNPVLKLILIVSLFVIPGSGVIFATYLLVKEAYRLWKHTALKKLD